MTSILKIQAAGITIVYGALYALSSVLFDLGLQRQENTFAIMSVSVNALLACVHLWWAWSARRVADIALARSMTNRISALLFVLPVMCGTLAAGIMFSVWPAQARTGDLRVDSWGALAIALIIFIGAASFFAAMWTTASALQRAAEAKLSEVGSGKLGKFILLVYLFVGVWWLKPLVKRISAKLAEG